VSITPSQRRESGTAWQLRFRSDETVEEGTKRILAALTGEMAAFLDDSESVGSDTAIHEVRRRGKQARALLRLVRPAIPDDFRPIDKLYRNAGRLLAPARDARIVVDALDDLAVDTGDVAQIRSSLDARATREARAVFDGGTSPSRRARALLTEAASSALRLEIPDDASSIADGATRTFASGQKAYRKAASKGSPVAFHTWRKRVKERRHHIAYLWDCTPIDPGSHEHLYELSDLLGDAHDLVVFRGHLAKATGGEIHTEASEAAELADRKRTTLEDHALRLGSLLYGEDSEQVHRMLISNWTMWQPYHR